jgi:hypothetical protein
MSLEDQLRDRLRKVEALFMGAATTGERVAAGAAAERLKAKLAEAARSDPPVERMFTMPDAWSVRLFIALCRRYGFNPYRYPRQRRTTVMVCAPGRAFDAMVWRPFVELHAELQSYFEKTTEALIRDAVYSDTADAETIPEPVSAVS